MFNPYLYLIFSGNNYYTQSGNVMYKARESMVEQLKMSKSKTIFWVDEKDARNIADVSEQNFSEIENISKLYIYQKPWGRVGKLLGYINIDDYKKLDVKTLINPEEGIMFYLADPITAMEFEKDIIKESRRTVSGSDKIVPDKIIQKLPHIPVKDGHLDMDVLAAYYGSQPGE